MVEEESNNLYQSLRLFHTILSLASDTRGLSGPVWTTVKSLRTQNLSVEVHGRWKDIISIHSNEKLVKFPPGHAAGSFKSFELRNALFGRNLCLGFVSLALTWGLALIPI